MPLSARAPSGGGPTSVRRASSGPTSGCGSEVYRAGGQVERLPVRIRDPVAPSNGDRVSSLKDLCLAVPERRTKPRRTHRQIAEWKQILNLPRYLRRQPGRYQQ